MIMHYARRLQEHAPTDLASVEQMILHYARGITPRSYSLNVPTK